jgi:protease-4
VSRDRIFIVLISVFLLASLIAASFLAFRTSTKTEAAKFSGDIKTLTSHPANIAVVYIYGTIQIQPSSSLFNISPGGADYIVQKLKRIRRNPNIKAVVLRINSPGGSVGAVQEIHNELLKLKESGKKLVASQGEVSASGGYYLAVAADKIVSNPGTLTGSIGVLVPITNFEGLFEKLGINVEVIKSSAHKDIGSSSRPLTQKERVILEDMVDSAYQQFLSAVKQGRGNIMTEEEIEEAADGRVMTGEQARDLGLVDELGNLEDAINIAAELVGIEKGEIRIFEEKKGWMRIFPQLETKALNPFSRFFPPKTGTLEYRWLPEY